MPVHPYSGTELVNISGLQYTDSRDNYSVRRQHVLIKPGYYENNNTSNPRKVISVFFSNAAVKALTGATFTNADLKASAKGIMLRLAIKNDALGIVSMASNGTLKFIGNNGYFNDEVGNGTLWIGNLEDLENEFKSNGYAKLDIAAPPIFQVSKASMLKLILQNLPGTMPTGTVEFQMNIPLESHNHDIQDYINFASVQTIDAQANHLLGLPCPPECYD